MIVCAHVITNSTSTSIYLWTWNNSSHKFTLRLLLKFLSILCKLAVRFVLIYYNQFEWRKKKTFLMFSQPTKFLLLDYYHKIRFYCKNFYSKNACVCNTMLWFSIPNRRRFWINLNSIKRNWYNNNEMQMNWY